MGGGRNSADGGGEARRALSVTCANFPIDTAAAEVQCSDCRDRRDRDSDGDRGGRDESVGGSEGREGAEGGTNGKGMAEGTDGKEGKEVDDPESLQWMVQGSLPLLIPHEPVLNSAELSVRIQAMQDTVVHPSSLLQGARSTMIAFAGENGENSFAGEDCTACGENSSGGGTRGGARMRRRGLWLPSGLREHERSVLHSEARDIGLYHISLGEGAERYVHTQTFFDDQ